MSRLLLNVFMMIYIPQLINCDIGCRDPNGNHVDWYVIYKLPRLEDNDNPLIKEGLGHFYLDVNSVKWSLSDVSLNKSGNHALYTTLQQIYNPVGTPGYVMYNDEVPLGNTSFTHGHTKGVLAFDDTTGFWLVHSLPKFPPHQRDGYSYPHNGLVYGQTFLCVTYGYKQFVNIGTQLMYNYPEVYDYALPDPFRSELSSMAMVVKGKHINSPPWYNVVQLVSEQSQKLTSFAKFKKFNADLYDSLVAPTLKVDLATETWMNGRGKMTDNCTAEYTVVNIKHLNFSPYAQFKNSEDHAKWAVADKNSDPNDKWVCIGDINRMETQKERGGGTVCFEVPQLLDTFHKIIDEEGKC